MAHLYVVPTCALCREPRSKSSMAIYHLSASIVKRSAGRSVTAAAAYRAAAKIEDITTGLVHDYTRKKGVDYSEIISPISASLGNEWLIDRQELWNKIEEVERRKDAQLAREITLAIPRELSRPEQIALVREYVQTNYVAAGMVADVNLHHLDGDNPHAHILLTMRNLQTTPEGIVKFGLKNTDWNSKDLLLTHRKSWEEITNKYLANYGSDIKIDCRSLKEQGSEFIPQIHVGVHAMAMHRQGKQTDRRDEFERIEAANNDIRARLEEIYQKEAAPESEPEAHPKNENEHKLGKLLDELLQRWGQRIFHPEDIKLVFYKIQPDQISIYIDEHPPQATRISSFKFIDDRWINTVQPKDNRYSIDNLITIVSDQHHRFDTGEIKKLELTDLERREIRWFRDWCGLELNDSRLATIRERGREIISNDLANDLVKWIDKNIPRTSEILTKDRIKEILADSSQPVIIIHNDRSNSVYTDYHLIDTLENKSLEIRHNRNRLEMISGVVTPLIAKQIKIITNELENPEEVTSDINRQIISPTSPPKVQSGDVVKQINLILQTLANQVEEKLEEPEKIESKPQMKELKTIESTPAIEKFKPIIVESDRIIEDEQPIKVVKTHQPRTIKRTRRQPDRGGR
jgi:hypothetical protein